MAQVAAAIAVIGKVVAVVAAAYKTYAAVRIIVTIIALIALASISKALTPKPQNLAQTQGQELQLKFDPSMPRQVIAGRTATGGSAAYAFTFTDVVKAPNKYLSRVIVLSDRPCSGVVAIYEGSQLLTFGSDDVLTAMARCDQHKKGADWHMWVHVELGSDDPVAHGFLTTYAPGWTANHKGVGICYAIVQYAYDPDAFPNGEPQLTFVMDGAKVYDDREDIDLLGTQELDNPDTWTFSRNASVIAHQFLRGFYTLDSLIVGSQADARDFDTAVVIAANNTCDEPVDLDAGGTEPRYQAGMMLTSINPVQQDLADLKMAMDGELYDRGGKITFFPGGTRTPVLNLTDADINWSQERTYQPYAGLSALFNTVQGSFVPEDSLFTAEPYPIKKDAAFIAADGGERIVLNADYRAVNSRTQMQRISARLLASSRFQKTIGFTGPLWLMELEQGDWMTITSERWGMTTKYFVVTAPIITGDLQVQLVAQETSADIDGWDPADEVPNTTLTVTNPDYSLPVPDLVLTALSETKDSTEFPVIKYDLTIVEGTAATGFNIQFRKEGTTTPEALPTIPLASPSGLISRTLMPSTVYQVRARSTDGRLSSDWTDWVDITTTDTLTADAGSLGGISAADWIAQFDAIAAEAAAATAASVAAIRDQALLAQTQIRAGIALLTQNDYTDKNIHIDGLKLHEVISLMGEMSGDHLSFIMDDTTFKLSSTESVLSRLTTYATQFSGGSSSYLLTQIISNTTATSATASLVNLLGAANGGFTAFILNSSTVKVDSFGTSLAQFVQGLSVNSAGASAIADTRITVQLGSGGSIASALTSVTSTANTASANATLALSTSNGNEATAAVITTVSGKVTGFKINGSTSDFIIQADKFGIVSSGGGSPIIPFAVISGFAYFANPITVVAGGKQVVVGPAFGTSGDLLLWFGPSSTAQGSMTKTNGYWTFGTDGKVYYGTGELSSGGGPGSITVSISHTTCTLSDPGGSSGTRTTDTNNPTISVSGNIGSPSYEWHATDGFSPSAAGSATSGASRVMAPNEDAEGLLICKVLVDGFEFTRYCQCQIFISP